MIRVNGSKISEEAIGREMQYHPADSQEEAWNEAATALVVRELLMQQADQQAVVAPAPTGEEDESTEEERQIDALLKQELQVPEPDREACRRFYDNNKSRFRKPDRFQVAHILLPASPEEETARESARVQAQELLDILLATPERFGSLAREHSACPSKEEDGDLGWVMKGQTVPEFETFLYEAVPGQLIPIPVPTPYGYHVVDVKAREGGEEIDFEEAKVTIAAYLQEQAWRRAVRQYISILAGQADIEGLEIEAAGSPLVQ
ncbi:MAG: peptidylprolyl isomerase [Pseudomonadota bacterium]